MEKFNKKLKKEQKNTQKSGKNTQINENFNKNDINFKKSLGQNFLFDTNLLNAIVNDGDVEEGDVVLEIGAGAGTLTKALSQKARKVISFEIDESLKPILEKRVEENSNIELHFQDFMEAEIDGLFDGKARVVANIPYYITTPIVFKLVEHIEKFKSIMVLVQKEVAERIVAKEGGKDYGVLSVCCALYGKSQIKRIVGRNMFYPAPKVDSAIVHIEIENTEIDAGLVEFVKNCFSMRRKTLLNNISSCYQLSKNEVATKLEGVDLTKRAEMISVGEYVQMYKQFKGSN